MPAMSSVYGIHDDSLAPHIRALSGVELRFFPNICVCDNLQDIFKKIICMVGYSTLHHK